MTTPTHPKPWYSCCLSATVEPEPQPIQPAHSPAYQYAGKFSPAHMQQRINAYQQKQAEAKAAVVATNPPPITKALPTSRRHRKLDSTEVVDLRGALMRSSITQEK